MGNQRFSITPARAALDPDLPDTVHRTLAVLGIYGDRNGWCWPALQTIADARNKDKSTISRHVKRLEEDGYLNIHPRSSPEKGQESNQYQIKFDYPPLHSERNPPLHPERNPPLHSERNLTSQVNDLLNDPKEKELTPHQQMFEALALITGTDYNIKSNAGILNKVAKQLLDAGYVPDFVQNDFMDWWLRHDFRGQKGQKPDPWQVAKMIGRVPTPELEASKRASRFKGSDEIDIAALSRQKR